MKTFVVLLAIFTIISTTPIGNNKREAHLNDDEKFDDVVDPDELIRETVDTESYKKALNIEKEKVKLDSRFLDVDDDDDFKEPDVDKLVASGKLLMPNHVVKEKGGRKNSAEYGKFYQGDMMLTKSQKKFVVAKDGISLPSRTGIIDDRFRWNKDNKGKVKIPYTFWSGSKYTNKDKEEIMYAMEYIETHTCIDFVPRSKEADFLLIYSGEGCSSYIGKIGGQQLVSLKKNGCLRTGTIMHELIHSIGYDHMQNHEDRDKHIQVVWDNIRDDTADNFVRVDSDLFSNFDTDYDYYSVMHYDSYAFSKNGKRTLVARDDDFRDIIGQRYALSYGDVRRINNMYDCN
ncbi:hypothetical protein PVAND_016378 [Polypedilum vanderplanki]|uniref:Metalloendopeptidase n=1 Tax=Polypedilum vanderplanki TaxID=319348 RepID=A0A9J6BG35_POLVA|nr:hypothetical protein PVAND_016378 [Polypedilum vanderplanki]